MKCFSNLVLGALFAAIVIIATDARGDWLYFNTRKSSTKATWTDVYDLSTGNHLSSPYFSGSNNQTVPEIHGGHLYLAGGAVGDIYKFDALTGAATTPSPFATVAIPGYTVKGRGLAIDGTGNLYLTMNPGGVAKISSAGVVDYDWGAPASGSYGTSCEFQDAEFFDNTLYTCSPISGYEGLWTYNSTGGTPSLLNGTGGEPIAGLAVVSADTIYTVNRENEPTDLYKWTLNGGTWSKESIYNFTYDTDIGGDPAYGYCTDVDYFDGSLFVSCVNMESGRKTLVMKLDDLDTTPTMSIYVDGGEYSDFAGHLAFGPAVPEPGTLALLASGLIGLLAYAWRKRK